jgi:hypothetical protein
MSGATMEGPGIASVFCHNGHRVYFFMNLHGEWETQAERQLRLSKMVTCKECNKPYRIPFLNPYNPPDPVCPVCYEKAYQAYQRLICMKRKLANGHRKNVLTPWRLGGSTLYR